MNIDYKKYFEDNKEIILKQIQELIAIPSVINEQLEVIEAPFGKENVEALEYMLNLGKEYGFKTYNCENVCGHIEYGDGDEVFAVLCHTDVVPAIGLWTKPPFESYIKDGKIYGRGSIDDKGPAIIAFHALNILKENNIKVNKKIRLIIGTDEETGSRGVKRYIKKVGMPDMGISPDADFPIIYGEKGICTIDIIDEAKCNIKAIGGTRYNIVAPSLEFSIENEEFTSKYDYNLENNKYYVEGESAHAMEPNNGVNAIKKFAELVKEYTDSKLIKFINDNLIDTRLKDMDLDITDKEMGDLTMNMGLLEMDNISKLGINIRYPHNLDFEKFYESFSDKAKKYGLKCVLGSNSKPHYVDPKSEFVQKLYSTYKKFTNDLSPMKTIGGGTYARELKLGVAFGVLFPKEKEMAHQTDEFANIENLFKAGEIIADAIYNICK